MITHQSSGRWYFGLGNFRQRQRSLREALHWLEMAVLYAEGQKTSVMYSMSQVLNMMGDYSRGLSLTRTAKHVAELAGNTYEQQLVTQIEAWSDQRLGDLRSAGVLCKEARTLCPPEIKGQTEELLADILIDKTEYREAQDILLGILAYRPSCRPAITDTVVCHLNICVIGIETGAELEYINHHLDSARLLCTTLVMWPLGILYCDALTANVHLQQGNIALARETFEKCFYSAQNTKDAQITGYCLSKLADLRHRMYSHLETGRWAVIFLTFRMATKNRVSITRALRCIGDLLICEGDDDTALALFLAALQTFTFMDIHRDRADCMVRIAEILEHRGEMKKSGEFLQKARPLDELSSQAQGIHNIE
jgi:tetratricopeptide (TPR) repeat protein